MQPQPVDGSHTFRDNTYPILSPSTDTSAHNALTLNIESLLRPTTPFAMTGATEIPQQNLSNPSPFNSTDSSLVKNSDNNLVTFICLNNGNIQN